MGMRAQGAAGPSIGAFTRGTQNIANGYGEDYGHARAFLR